MKALELNQMELVNAGKKCSTGDIVGTITGSALMGALFGGGIPGALLGTLRGAGVALIRCVVTHDYDS